MSVSLRSLSDHAILSRILELTRRERSLTLLVLIHLNEIERRRLHLKQGYSSMFDYCTSKLGYSASAASRRIKTARCVARFPEVYELLESNQVNVSTVAQVSRILTPENKGEILSRIRGSSQREVEAVVAGYEPLGSMPRDRVRTVVVRVRASATTEAGAANSVVVSTAAGVLSPPAFPTAVAPAGPVADPAPSVNSIPGNGLDCSYDRNGCAGAATLERRALIQFSASDAFMAKLEKVRSLAWHRLPANASLEQVFELALDLLIEREDPRKRRERRERRTRREQRQVDSRRRHSTDARQIPAATRDAVHARDKGRCTFVGANGRRCASTRALQIDHVKPVAFGGAGTPDNLRLLCAYHNRLEAERLLGSASGGKGAQPAPS